MLSSRSGRRAGTGTDISKRYRSGREDILAAAAAKAHTRRDGHADAIDLRPAGMARARAAHPCRGDGRLAHVLSAPAGMGGGDGQGLRRAPWPAGRADGAGPFLPGPATVT